MNERNLDLSKKFEASLVASKKSKNTIRQYMTHVKQFGNFLKDKVFTEVDNDDINIYFSQLVCADRTRNQKIQGLKKFYTYLVNSNKMDKSPMMNMENVHIGTEEIILLEDAEVNKILKKALKHTLDTTLNPTELKLAMRNHLFLTMLAHTGMRENELSSLTVDCVNVEEEVVKVFHTKNRNYREIPLSDTCLVLFKQYVEKFNIEKGLLFTSNKGNALVNRDCNTIVRKYGEACGIDKEKLHCHSFRKYCGTKLYNRFHDLKLCSDILGNSVEVCSKIYIQADKDDKRNKIKALFK